MQPKIRIGHLVFELTESCNQNCLFCYNHWRPTACEAPDRKSAARTLRRIFRNADIGSFSFSGGEPALLSNIFDLALACRFRGAGVNILTNGTLLSHDSLLICKDIGVGALQIPLLSNMPDVHDRLTCVKGSWAKAYATICDAISVLGSSHVAIVLILNALNVHTLEDTLALYHSTGVKTVMVNRFNPGGNGLRHLDELCLSHEGLRTAFRIVSDFALAHRDMNFVSGVCTPMCIADPGDYPGIAFSSCSTDLASRPLTINYKGDVRFCNHSPFIMGNIYDRPLRDILEDSSMVSRYSTIPAGCSSCEKFSRCKGGCRAASEQYFGSFDAADPILVL